MTGRNFFLSFPENSGFFSDVHTCTIVLHGYHQCSLSPNKRLMVYDAYILDSPQWIMAVKLADGDDLFLALFSLFPVFI